MFMTFLGLPRCGRPQRSSRLSHAEEILSESPQTYRILMKEIPRTGLADPGSWARSTPPPIPMLKSLNADAGTAFPLEGDGAA